MTAAPPDDPTTAGTRDAPDVAALVDAARAGDREAFGALVTLHQRAVFRAALAALGDREDAEDAAQDALVVAWRKLGGFRGESSFRTWLLAIAWRKALDRRRLRRLQWRRQGPAGADSDDRGLERVASRGADPERRAVAVDLAARTREEIRRLTPKLRDTLLLAASQQYSYGEIAAMLGVPVGTVKWRVAEARRLVGERVPGHARGT